MPVIYVTQQDLLILQSALLYYKDINTYPETHLKIDKLQAIIKKIQDTQNEYENNILYERIHNQRR